MREQCNSLGIRFEVVEGITPKDRRNFSTPERRGCYLSKMNAVQKGIDSGSKYFMVLEDDCTFCEEFINKTHLLLKTLEERNVKWDICNLFHERHFLNRSNLRKFELFFKENPGTKMYEEISLEKKYISGDVYDVNYPQANQHAFIVNKDSSCSILYRWILLDDPQYVRGNMTFGSDMFINLNKNIIKISPKEHLVSQNRKFISDNPASDEARCKLHRKKIRKYENIKT
jgi:GR25 family glycosyltransferase involved in LPS biosynthesis